MGLTEIRGRIGGKPGGITVIKYLIFKTPQKTLDFGKSIPADQEFVLPPVCEIAELVENATSTIAEFTKTVTITADAVTEMIFVDNPRTIIIYSE
ncbi:6215_t:CDS:2 [Entrophospora sp. SA101]|nr:6215_t:CDS:2 [Entrophospora sp. SA101]